MLIAYFAVGQLAVLLRVDGALCSILTASLFVMSEHLLAVEVLETSVAEVTSASVTSASVSFVLTTDQRAEVLDPHVV